ncbi:MAG: LysM peptidoglycan-binding domain-containing protein [Treponema sp.]|nr:LysM peptidoglycan-binding domain-containing protein [Treponema sp.]
MNRSLIIIPVLMAVFGAQAIFAQAVPADADIPASIRNNRYFVESVRLTILAQQTFDEGDYLASIQFSEEAMRFAALSDEFVYLQLRMWETDNAIAAARQRLTYATAADAASRYPQEFGVAQTAYGQALTYRAAAEWDDAIDSALQVLAALANISGLPPHPAMVFLPSQHTVRLWIDTGDSLWNIAGQPWAFNDPWQWRRLYEANLDRMPDPGNPDLIHPGMILNIPSIRGETRQGMWDAAVVYPALP